MYQVKFNTENDTLEIIFNDNKSLIFHHSTNFPDYQIPPNNLLLKTCGDSVTYEKDHLLFLENWTSGNFILENNELFSRLSQYEFDRLCFTSSEYGEKYNDNKLLFEKIMKYNKN